MIVVLAERDMTIVFLRKVLPKAADKLVAPPPARHAWIGAFTFACAISRDLRPPLSRN